MALHGLGRLVAVDPRDGLHLLFRKAKKSKRVTRYWYDNRWWADQGETPHCVGYAWAHWLVNTPVINYMDPNGLYALAQQNDEWPGEDYDGTTVRAGAKVLRTLGFIHEYKWAFTLDTLVEALLEKGPVVVGTDWYEAMSNPNRYGKIKIGGKKEGGHAYLLTGVDTKKRVFRIKNSWGRAWGKQGRALIGFAEMRILLREKGEACLAVERAVTSEGLPKAVKK